MYHRSWGGREEYLEIVKNLPVMLTDKGELGLGEHKWTKTREEYWNTIYLIYMKAGSRVSTMSSSHSRVKDSSESILVSSESGQNGYCVT